MDRPLNYYVGDDPDPTGLDPRGFRTAYWNKYTDRWEMFCPPFKVTCCGDLHVVDIVGVCDCDYELDAKFGPELGPPEPSEPHELDEDDEDPF